jgi:chromate transporter
LVDAAMTDGHGALWTLGVNFAVMSLFAIGGANAAVPEVHRLSVVVMHWMTDQQFSDMFALAQMAPGPNVLIVTLIGYHVAGVAGGVVATVGMCGPASLFAFWFAKTWDRFKGAKWRIVVQAALVPLSLGLVAASAYVVTRATDQSPISIAITVVTAVITFATRLNPLWVFAGAGLLGLVGLK